MPAVDPAPGTLPLTRLPGRAARLRVDGSPGGTLWLGPHHLLQVRSGVWREGYRRFAYRDIQAIGVRRTVRGVIYNVLLGALAALFGVIALLIAGLAAAPPAGGVAVVGGVAGCFLALLLVNVLRGATVRADLRTAVGRYPLPSLSRMRPARRALELIGQRVEAVQGPLSEATLVEGVARLSQPAVGPR